MSAEDEAYEAARRLIAEAKATGAEKLDLSGEATRALTQLPPEIGELGHLRALNLSDTRVAHLDLLVGLTDLRMLFLNRTYVTRLDPLAGLVGLTHLFLRHTEVSRLGPLTALTGLKELHLDYVPVTNLEPLAGLIWLDVLYLPDTPITTLDPLAGLKGLRRLWLGQTHIVQIDPIAELTGLKRLYLGNTKKLKDLRAIEGLESLIPNEQYGEPTFDGLDFHDSRVCDLDPDGLGQLALIEDTRERTEKTLAYLRTLTVWPPRRGRGEEAALPDLPGQRPAPVQAEWDLETFKLRLRRDPVAFHDARLERAARDRWQALKEYQASIGELLTNRNLPGLADANVLFGRALGDTFDELQLVRAGMQGKRIIRIAAASGEVLLDHEAADLKGYADEISLFLQRFPETAAYQADAEITAPSVEAVTAAMPALETVAKALAGEDWVEADLGQALLDTVTGQDATSLADPAVRKGIVVSISNFLSPVFELALSVGRFAGRGIGRVTSDVGSETYKGLVKAVSTSLVAVLCGGAGYGMALAAGLPADLGWLGAALPFLQRVLAGLG